MNKVAFGAPENIKKALTEKFPEFEIKHDIRLRFCQEHGVAEQRQVIIPEGASVQMPTDEEIMYLDRVVLCLTRR